MKISAYTAFEHGHLPVRSVVHRDDYFCAHCGAWFVPKQGQPTERLERFLQDKEQGDA
jgi:hypothetical protein